MEKNVEKDEAIFRTLRTYIRESKFILYEGNNYSEEWIREAAARGLENTGNTPEALSNYLSGKTVDLFSRNGIFTEKEMVARYEIRLETYAKALQIESRVLGDLAGNHIIPVAVEYQNRLIQNVKGLKDVLPESLYNEHAGKQIHTITKISEHISEIKTDVADMISARKEANAIDSPREKAEAYAHRVKPMLETIRYHIDKLEILVDDRLWPLPKYREMLFVK